MELNRSDSISQFKINDFSLSNPQLTADPYPYYDKIRQEDPIHYSKMYGGSWLLFSYDDVKALLTDPRLTNDRSALPLMALPEEERAQFTDMIPILSKWLAFFDGNDHTQRRQRLDGSCPSLLNKGALSNLIRNVAEDLMDGWQDRDCVDLIADFARPLPAIVITRLLGGEDGDHEQLTRWSDDIAYLFGASDLAVEDMQRGQKSLHAFNSYLHNLADEAIKSGREDLILNRLVSDNGKGLQFDIDSATAQCMLLMFAGLEPTRYLLGNAVWALHQHPLQRHVLATDLDQLPMAVEEFLRYGTPVQYIGRRAATTFTYKNFRIEEGQLVLPYVGSANRDPTVFDHPETLDLRRTPNRHLSFGTGPHACIGSTLVRQQTQIALSLLLTRYPSFEVSQQIKPVWNTNLGFHGPTSLMINTGKRG
ncbi:MULTISPECIES: cytochrome P450 [Serratia]|uniref:Cytochrome P450 n=1 Tax=Serratia fonticola TaxID=47917 RepID=A0AAW3X1W7_SERFO|nr:MULTISPECIES: cytochrome P450 [Serratia]MBC3215862.1 cytochrome P450 [Serratia fonticola]NBJ36287.1 cytochrome P450 [Serratia fonticola]NYA15138.1 cytochrome P450 [Serratia fonticola]NYA36517.1 cytochrome P450 [Serratia fonticola]